MQQQGHVLRRLCRQGNVELVSQMLDAGVAVDSAQEDGCTGLWLASEHGCTEVARLLLSKGASAQVTKTSGNVSALFIACQNGHGGIVDLLLHHGANPNVCKNSGASPCFISAQQGHSEITRALLRAGANHSAATSNGVTPLMIAAFQGNIQCVRLLLAAGADPHAVAQGKNTIEWAAENRHRGQVEDAINEHLRVVQGEMKRKRDLDNQGTPLVARRSARTDDSAGAGAGAAESASSLHHHQGGDVSFPGTNITGAGMSPGSSYRAASTTLNQSGMHQPHDGGGIGRSTSAGYRQSSPVRAANTRSFSEPLPYGTGNMTPVTSATGGVTARAIEEEKRRSSAFRGAVRRDTVATRPKASASWLTGGGSSAVDKSVFAVEQEWRAHQERLDALEQQGAHDKALLPDQWMYSAAATSRYAEQQYDLRRRMAEAARLNREQIEQSKRGAADAGFAFPRLASDKMARLKTFMEVGRGASGPPPPLEPEPEPEPQVVAPARPIGLFAADPVSTVPASSAASPSAAAAASSPTKPLSAAERLRMRQAARNA